MVLVRHHVYETTIYPIVSIKRTSGCMG